MVSADHKAPTMCFRDEGREGWKSNKLDCGNIQISHSHSYVTRPSTGESVRAYEKSQLIDLLVTVPKTQTQTNQANVL